MSAANEGGNGGPLNAEESPPELKESPKVGLTLGFALTGLTLTVAATMSNLVDEIPLSAELGLLQMLPALYWSGLSLIALSMAIAMRDRSSALIVLTGTLFFAVFAGTPNLFEPNPRYWDAYEHLGSAQSIGFLGRLSTAPEEYSTNWPGFFMIVQLFSEVGGFEPLQILVIFPFLTAALTFFALFVFLRSLFPPHTAGLASIMGSLLSVWAQYHLSPQSVGLLLMLMVLATVWRRSTGMRTASALLFAGLVITHPTSSVLLLFILAAHVVLTWAVRAAKPEETSTAPRDINFEYNPILPFGVAWLGWLFFQATGSSRVAEMTIVERMGEILRVPEQAVSLVASRSVENLFVWAPTIRLASLIIFAVVVIVALVLHFRREGYRRWALFFLAAIIGLSVFAMADILAFQGLLIDRSFAIFAVLAPAICLAGLRTRRVRKSMRRGIVAVLVIASIAAASTAYYQEAFNFVSSESVAVANILERGEPGSLVLDGLYPTTVWLGPGSRIPLRYLAFYEAYPQTYQDFTTGTVYTVFDPTSLLWYRQWYGLDIYRFYESNRTEYSLIYTNGEATIYVINLASPGE